MMGMHQKQGPWPECKGMEGEECCELIHGFDKEIECNVLAEDSMVTLDFRPDRVRVFVNEEKVVVRTPGRG